MKEKDIEAAVCKYAKDKYGALAYKFTSPAHRSVPDRLFLFPGGKTLFIEFKTEKGKPTTGQLREIVRIKDLDHHAYIVNSVEKGKLVVDLYAR